MHKEAQSIVLSMFQVWSALKRLEEGFPRTTNPVEAFHNALKWKTHKARYNTAQFVLDMRQTEIDSYNDRLQGTAV